MAQLLDKQRPRRPFARADILSRMGETICLPDFPIERAIPKPRHTPPPPPPPKQRAVIIDEEPERWDGLS
jgi:hypothetical protein